jgi:hypothetical protein
MSDTLTAIRSKYPQYADMDDQSLATAVAAKYPVYAEQDKAFAAEAAGRVLMDKRSPTLQGLRDKYPEYGDMTDTALATAVAAKHPEYVHDDPVFAVEAGLGARGAGRGASEAEQVRSATGWTPGTPAPPGAGLSPDERKSLAAAIAGTGMTAIRDAADTEAAPSAVGQAADTINEGLGQAMHGVGTAAATAGNIPIDFYNTMGRITRMWGPVDRLEAGKTVGPAVTKQGIRDILHRLAPTTTVLAEKYAPEFMEGVEGSAAKTANSLKTPEMLATLPLGELKVVRALFGAQIVASAPETLTNTVKVFQDPKSTRAEKWGALGDAGQHLLMLGAVGYGIKEGDVEKGYDPEEVAARFPDKAEALAYMLGKEVKEKDLTGFGAKTVPPLMNANPRESEPETLVPALRKDGQVYSGSADHAGIRILEASKEDGEFLTGEEESGFLHNGKFITRQEAAPVFERLTGKKPMVPGMLHSEDLVGTDFVKDLPTGQQVMEQLRAKTKGGDNNVIQNTKAEGSADDEGQGGRDQNVSRKPGDETAAGTPGVSAAGGKAEEGAAAGVTAGAGSGALGAGKPGAGGLGEERPPDVLDYIDKYGGRRINLAEARRVIPGFKPTSLARKYFVKEGGFSPDQVLSGLHREGVMQHVAGEQVQEFLEAMNEAGPARAAAKKKAAADNRGLAVEAKQTDAFGKVVVRGQRPKWDWRAPVQVKVGDLLPGDKFEVMGHEFTVKEHEFDADGFLTSLTVKDGPKFGVQRIDPANTEVIHVDEGSYLPKDADFVPGQTKADEERIKAAPGESPAATGGSPVPPTEGDPDWSVGPVTEGDHIGMGNALYNEVSQPGSFVSNMFAAIDADRKAMGKAPMPDTNPRSWDEDNARALTKMNREPGWIPNLIDEVTNHPRPLLSWENAGLVWHRAKLKAELNNAFARINRAFEDGREGDQAEARLYAAKVEDDLQRLDEAVGRNGTGSEAGRSLNAQKMAGNTADFSLVEMRLATRASKGGAPLTPAEESEVARLHQEIANKQKALDEYVAASEEKIRQAGIERQIAEAKAAAAERAQNIHPRVLQYAKDIVAKLDTRANAARVRLREKLGRVSAGVDPTILADLAEIGASHLAHNLVDAAEWGARMVAEAGEWIRPHLKEVRDASNALFYRDTVDAPAAVKAVFKKSQTPAEQRVAAAEVMKEKVKEAKTKASGGSPDATGKLPVPPDIKKELTYYVQRVARAFVADGISEREALLDAVHKVMQEVLPDMTRRDTMDAISGYGDWKQLSKDAISVRLRGLKGEMLEVAKLEDMASGKPPLKTGVQRGEVTEARRKLIQKVNQAKREFQIPISDPETQLASALDTYKKVLARRAADYEDRLARGDFEKREKKEIKLDHTALQLKAAAESAKNKFQRGLENFQRANRPMSAKLREYWVKFRRAQLLSSPLTLAKLTAAAAERIAFTPAEEAVGAGWSAMFPGLASKAAREGGFSTRAEVRAITDGLMRGVAEMGKVVRTGKSTIDEAFGRDRDYPVDMIGFLGRLHQALKQPAKMAEFERSYYKRSASLAAAGVDITDPLVKMRINAEAYEDANRAIFSQNNFLVKRLRLMLHEGPNATFWEKTWHLIGNTAFPIVRIPTNVVAEAFEYALGLPAEGIRFASRGLRKAFGQEVAALTPQEADLVMRHLKKGTIGAAVMLAGYFMPQYAGGFWQPGAKRDPRNPRWGSLKIGGVNIPSFLLDNPLLMVFQLGATIRHVQDSKQAKRSPTTRGLTSGAMAGALGMAAQAPFLGEITDLAKAFNVQEQQAFFGELGKSLIVPQLLQNIAKWQDTATKPGSGMRRAPESMGEHIEEGVPFLRERVKMKASVDNR